jgi:hypothetical protein
MLNWPELLHPELRKVPELDRERVWRSAKTAPLRPGEYVLVLAGLAVAALVVKYAAFKDRFGSAFLGFAADFIVAAILLLAIVGPIYLHRTKRALAEAIKKEGV